MGDYLGMLARTEYERLNSEAPTVAYNPCRRSRMRRLPEMIRDITRSANIKLFCLLIPGTDRARERVRMPG